MFAHPAVLREELPITADGAGVTAHSASARDVHTAMRPFLRNQTSFPISDLCDDPVVDCSPRSVQRMLAEFTESGYLNRQDPGAGQANTVTTIADLGLGETLLLTIKITRGGGRPGESPDGSLSRVYDTGSVGVCDYDGSSVCSCPEIVILPAPEEDATDLPLG